jgi:hypothetical protein
VRFPIAQFNRHRRDLLNNRIGRARDLIVRKPYHRYPKRLESSLPNFVLLPPLFERMGVPIKLDGKLHFGAVEVVHVAIDTVLPAELETVNLPIAQSRP